MFAACEIAAAVSRRKQVFKAAASSGDNGGVSRVFTRPASGALVITASAVRPENSRSLFDGSRTRCVAFIRGVLSAWGREGSTLFAERVLIPSVAPGFDLFPGLRGKKAIHFAHGKHPGTSRFAVAVFETRQSGKDPHCEEWDRRPKRPPWFGNKAPAARFKNPIHFRYRSTTVRQHREKARRDEHIERSLLMRKLENVVTLESAVVQAER